ncbi:alpha/beta hydrolase [Exilibacterium tricleocarpae]|uniref:Alpha/beta hydrolase n=1 Tax=Exilibacterium tricleocarpae TaxID=2591008 RepID=A0A545SRX6_9GAMM|nr:alpha/beta hydrolase [Exilibacterium tricleocarpae]
MLALHGWLDNSASFTPLAPLLDNVHLLALDMAGHGQSGHRARFSPYNVWQDVGEIFAIADQMGWEKFALIGHSRGAIVSMLSAGTFPERITHLGLIDGLWPQPVLAADAPAQLARSITGLLAQQTKTPAVYADIEAAVNARANGHFELSHQAAALLTERGLRLVPDGYTWSTDPQLFVASAMKLTQAHIEAFIQRITAPVKLVLAKEGLLNRFEQYQQNLAAFPHIEVEVLPGGHHLHMEAESLKIAALFNDLLSH